MSTLYLVRQDPAAQKSLHFLQLLLRDYHPRNFAVRLWDGTIWNADPGQPALFTLVLRHKSSLRNMFWPPSALSPGEAYIRGDFDIEGDMQSVFTVFDALLEQKWTLKDIVHLGARLFALPSGRRTRAGIRAPKLKGKPHSKERDKKAVTYHYDRSNDFYKLWLDRRMIYSCAYFASENEDLESAQERKLDYICRKLRLRPGERLLDIGCGWGGLLLHAASRYGVKALGVTLSRPQAELASARIKELDLGDCCRVETLDYRDITEWGAYDKLVSVGMFEHVGGSRLSEYFGRAARLLKSGGVFLNHGIASSAGGGKSRFFDRYVFPDGELIKIGKAAVLAEQNGFEVRDLESLREHYALTLRKWVRRLEEHQREACHAAGEESYRVWRLFMSGCAHGFQTGCLNVYQMLLVKPDRGRSGFPLTRGDWYA